MILNTDTVTPAVRQSAIEVAEAVFETHSHPDQMQASEVNFNKLRALSPDSILYEVNEDGSLHGWVVVVPTYKEFMQRFLDKEIGEQTLLDLTQPGAQYSALYLCAAVTLPEYRRQGIAARLTKEALSHIPLTIDYELFAWPLSSEGGAAIKKIEVETGKVVHILS